MVVAVLGSGEGARSSGEGRGGDELRGEPIYRRSKAVEEEHGGGGGQRARRGGINGVRPLASVVGAIRGGDATARLVGTWRGRLRSSSSSCAGSNVEAVRCASSAARRAARRGGQATGRVGERRGRDMRVSARVERLEAPGSARACVRDGAASKLLCSAQERREGRKGGG